VCKNATVKRGGEPVARACRARDAARYAIAMRNVGPWSHVAIVSHHEKLPDMYLRPRVDTGAVVRR